MKILVIGDSCQDIFVYGECKRLCPEAPVPIFSPKSEKTNGGMAKNVQANIIDLDVDCDIMTNENWRYVLKTRYVDVRTNQLLLRIDRNDIGIEHIGHMDLNNFQRYDAIVISDYDKGFLNENDIEIITKNHPLTFIDTKKTLGIWCTNVSFIKINHLEYLKTKYTIHTVKNIKEKLIITKGEEGCFYKDHLIPNKKTVEVRDLSGAGDTFLAGLVIEYVKTKDIYKAIDFAQECSAIVVGKKGVCTIK